MLWESLGDQNAISWPAGAREAGGRRKSIFCERARNSCEHPPFRCRVVNLERSNTVKNVYNVIEHFAFGDQCTLDRPLKNCQDPYRTNLFGELCDCLEPI